MTTGAPAGVEAWLDVDLDAWTKTVVRRHFDREAGSPHWLARLPGLGFDPFDVTRYDQLPAFGPFDLDVLRTGDPADLVPLAVPRPLSGRVWESGGTTGTPCRVFYTPDMLRHRGEWRRWSFEREGFLPRRRWLQATPTGPHLIGNGVWETGTLHSAMVYSIDMDPRWVKRLIRAGRFAEVADYTAHLTDQIADVLATGAIDYLNTTPALLAALARAHPRAVAALAGARLSGTQLTAPMYRDLHRALDGGLLGASYGNTFGNAASLPIPATGDPITYVPNHPQVTMAVVDRADQSTVVAEGKPGQVRLTVLHEDLFLPNILERDEALRVTTPLGWPSDGVANVRPLQTISSQPEGLY